MYSENDYILKQDFFVADSSNESPIFEENNVRSHEMEPKLSTSLSYEYDPFQIFQVIPEKCHSVVVTVMDGFYSTTSWLPSLLHSPSLYVILDIPNTPNSHKRTAVANSGNLIWNETFTFLINPNSENILLIDVMEPRMFRSDLQVGMAEVDLNELPLDRDVEAEFQLKENSKIYFKMTRTEDSKPDLRFSLSLSDEEKEFLVKRREHAFEALKKFMPAEDAPKHSNEVPTIGVLGSGGGFRAMVGLSGAMKALVRSGALDCVTYLATLSGGSWYISYLYSQPDFPEKGPADYQEKLKASLCKNNWLKLITPTRMYSYISPVLQKSRNGQPVSLTDFFGHLVGDTIMTPELKHCTRLSDQAKKLDRGQAPLPLYTCINVKKQVSARVFQDWMEFSPYEIGFAKYGTFMKSRHFGSKFFMGKLLLEFEEQPLHYLQGLWGSAFCILFKRLLHEKEFGGRASDEIHAELSEEEFGQDEESILNSYYPDEKDLPEMNDDSCSSSDGEEYYESRNVAAKESASLTMGSTNHIVDSGGTLSEMGSDRSFLLKIKQSSSSAESKFFDKKKNVRMHRSKTWMALPKPKPQHYGQSLMKMKPISTDKIGKSFWEKTLDNLFKSNVMNTRVGRAGLIFNPMRGLNFAQMCLLSPLSPSTSEDDADFKGHYEATEVQAKKLFLVDSGLTFNLPFPLLMRPQRDIDIYLTFDFSSRPTDVSTPFKDLLLVEKWAKLNQVLFPSIEELADQYRSEPLREFYLFENENDPFCPIILHFILINKKFKLFKSPGVHRTTQEEIEAANFSVFGDPKYSFSVFNFSYTQDQYDQLMDLMEFNTLESMPAIKEQIAKAIKRKRNFEPTRPVKFSKVDSGFCKSNLESLQPLKDYGKSMTELGYSENEKKTNK